MWMNIDPIVLRGLRPTVVEPSELALIPNLSKVPYKLVVGIQTWRSLLRKNLMKEAERLASTRSTLAKDISANRKAKEDRGEGSLEKSEMESSTLTQTMEDSSKTQIPEDIYNRLAGEAIAYDAISKLLFCMDEPQGSDTRITLNIEECHALLASLPHHIVGIVNVARDHAAHGTKYKTVHRVYNLEGAGKQAIERIAKVRHTSEVDIKHQLSERGRAIRSGRNM